MKIQILFIITVILVGCNQNKNSRIVASKINGEEIYLDQVDSTIIPILANELDKIYISRKVALEEIINDKLLNIESKELNISTNKYLDNLYRKILTTEYIKNYIMSLKNDTLIPEIISNKYNTYSVNDIYGNKLLINDLKRKLKKDLLDSLKTKNEIQILLSPPLKQYIYLDDIKKVEEGNLNSKITFTIISDFDCISCRKLYPFIKKLKEKYKSQIKFEMIYYSENLQLSGLAYYASSYQDKQKEFEDVLYSLNYDPNDTLFFKNVAIKNKMDTAKFIRNINDPKFIEFCNQNLIILNKRGINITPTFLLNHKLISNFATPQEVDNLLSQTLKND